VNRLMFGDYDGIRMIGGDLTLIETVMECPVLLLEQVAETIKGAERFRHFADHHLVLPHRLLRLANFDSLQIN
jgi:hypothetical protein